MKLPLKLFCISMLALFVLTALSGCAPHFSSDEYSEEDVGKYSRAISGVIINKRIVHIKPAEPIEKNSIGALLGAGFGGAIGSRINGDEGSMGSIIGLAVGGFIGAVMEELLTEQASIEYIVESTRGKVLFNIVQSNHAEFEIGDSVYLLQSFGGRAKLIERNP